MTDSNDKASPARGGVTLSKRALLILGGVVVVLLLVAGGAIGVLAFKPGASSEAAATPSPADVTQNAPATDAAPVAPAAPAAPTPAPTPSPTVLPLNTKFVVAGATMTVTGSEVLHSIPTIDGSSMVAPAGQQLVLVHTIYTVSGTAAVDLSCAGGDGTYIQAYDTAGNEMAAQFKDMSIAGNPGCNEYLPHGITHTWNFAYLAAAGTTPGVLSVTDSNTYNTVVFAALK